MSEIYWNSPPLQKDDDPTVSNRDYCSRCSPDMWNALPRTSTASSIPSLDMTSEQLKRLDDNRYLDFKEHLEADNSDRRYCLRGTRRRQVRGLVSGNLVVPRSQPRTPAKFDAMKEIREFLRARLNTKRQFGKSLADCTIGNENPGIQSTSWGRCECEKFWESRLMRRIGRYFACLRGRMAKTVKRCKNGLLRGKTPVLEALAGSNVKFRCTEIIINNAEYVNVDFV